MATLGQVWRPVVGLVDPVPQATRLLQALEIVKRTLVFFVLDLGVVLALAALGIRPGNAAGEEIAAELGDSLLATFLLFTLLVPALEELVFRFLPSRGSDLAARGLVALARRARGAQTAAAVRARVGDERSRRWALGVPVAALFALVHNVAPAGENEGIPLGDGFVLVLTHLPVPQFLLGLFTWNLVRRFGLGASILGHAAHNAISLGLVLMAR